MRSCTHWKWLQTARGHTRLVGESLLAIKASPLAVGYTPLATQYSLLAIEESIWLWIFLFGYILLLFGHNIFPLAVENSPLAAGYPLSAAGQSPLTPPRNSRSIRLVRFVELSESVYENRTSRRLRRAALFDKLCCLCYYSNSLLAV